jgi:CysZ protein
MHTPTNNFFIGSQYFWRGLGLLGHPKLRVFVVIPIAINCLLFIALTAVMIRYFDQFAAWELPLPAILQFLEKILKWVAWFLIIVLGLIFYAYAFNIVTNLIAAPFYGLLAQKTAELIADQPGPPEPLTKMILRTLIREAHKLLYFFTRGIFIFLIILLLSLTFILNFLVPILGTLWGAWSMAIQYADYAADCHQTPFLTLRKILRKRKYSSLGFGCTVMGFSMIPLANILATPAAVIGGTLFWLNEGDALAKRHLGIEHGRAG